MLPSTRSALQDSSWLTGAKLPAKNWPICFVSKEKKKLTGEIAY
jgi:hypothetical protein